MSELQVITNNVPRPVVEAYELTLAERAEFNYLDWHAIDKGEASASFVRYKGTLHDLGDFMTTRDLPEYHELRKWHGYASDSFFSGIVVRYCQDYEYVIVGRYYS